jgi:hypothetical protein
VNQHRTRIGADRNPVFGGFSASNQGVTGAGAGPGSVLFHIGGSVVAARCSRTTVRQNIGCPEISAVPKLLFKSLAVLFS